MPLLGWCRSGLRSQTLPDVSPTPLARGYVLPVPHARVPPDAVGLGPVFRQQQFKSSLAVVARLFPSADPFSVIDADRCDSASLPCVGTVSGCVECRLIRLVFFLNFPLAAEIGRSVAIPGTHGIRSRTGRDRAEE